MKPLVMEICERHGIDARQLERLEAVAGAKGSDILGNWQRATAGGGRYGWRWVNLWWLK